MTRTLALSAAVAASILASGCFVALHPLVTPEVRVFEPALVGTWEEPGGDNKDVWAFKPEPARRPAGYLVEVTEQQRPAGNKAATPLTATFTGTIGRFGDLLVLDLLVDRERSLGPLKDHGMLMFSLVPAHVLFRVRLDGDRLLLSGLDAKWLDKAIAEKKVTVAHEDIGEEDDPHEPGRQDTHSPSATSAEWILLTAPTHELQALVRQHGKSGLFSEEDPGALVRKR
jgi:hypothetical protein